jgi:hypothetical protein
MYNKQALLAAVERLIGDPLAAKHYSMLTELAKLPSDTPVALVDEAAYLAPMLELAMRDKPVFAKVIRLVDNKRAAHGMPALAPPEDEPGFNRNEYQRDFMQQKRLRERRAVNIENMLRPARDKLVGNVRLEFMRRASAQWKARRDSMIGGARDASGGTLSKEQVTAILRAFWQKIDDELDAAEAEAIRKIRGL